MEWSGERFLQQRFAVRSGRAPLAVVLGEREGRERERERGREREREREREKQRSREGEKE